MERERHIEGRKVERWEGRRRPREERDGLRGGIGNICGGLTAAPPLCLIQTTTHNKAGRWARNGVRADCEGDDTWAVFCCRQAVFYERKMATNKR